MLKFIQSRLLTALVLKFFSRETVLRCFQQSEFRTASFDTELLPVFSDQVSKVSPAPRLILAKIVLETRLWPLYECPISNRNVFHNKIEIEWLLSLVVIPSSVIAQQTTHTDRCDRDIEPRWLYSASFQNWSLQLTVTTNWKRKF